MTISTLLGHGVFLLGLLLCAFVRPGAERRSASRRRDSERRFMAQDAGAGFPRAHLSSSTLAGMPLWILRSERSCPGALLRDTLLIRPSQRDR